MDNGELIPLMSKTVGPMSVTMSVTLIKRDPVFVGFLKGTLNVLSTVSTLAHNSQNSFAQRLNTPVGHSPPS
jgi:hypothetical protein